MSRKDYMKFVRMFRTYEQWGLTLQQLALLESLKQSVAVLFNKDNSRFNKEEFLTAIKTGRGLNEQKNSTI